MKKFFLYSITFVMTIVMVACGGGNDPAGISRKVMDNLKNQKPSESMKYVHPDDSRAAASISEVQQLVDAGHGSFFDREYSLKETIENPESNAYLAVYSYPAENAFGSDDLYVFLQKIDGKWYYRENTSAGYVSNIKKCIQNGIELPPLCTDSEARKLLN